MVAEDALAAAKASALRFVVSNETSNPLESVTTTANGSRDVASRKKRRRRRKRQQPHQDLSPREHLDQEQTVSQVEYVPEPLENVETVAEQFTGEQNASAMEEIVSAINRFASMGPGAMDTESANEAEKPSPKQRDLTSKQDEARNPGTLGDADKENGEKQPLQISRKKQKEQRRQLIARLKEISEKPEVVESWDINSPDPVFLVHLKAYPNSVPVPINWSQKRKYLQNKRGMEKRAFQLPAYIVDTGIGALRDAQIEAEEKKTLKQRQREKMRAKTGKGVEIDNQRLHDAFFKFQTKPRLTKQGDVYYELKELEIDGSQYRPGMLGDELRAALGISAHDPPPWLINMQRYGPPPSYPGLTVPGVNAPIPMGSRFGYHVGGWGKPPVDPSGRPIYGDVFGEGFSYGGEDTRFETPQAEKDYLWGEIKASTNRITISAEEESSEEEEGERDVSKVVKTGWTPTQLASNEGSVAQCDVGRKPENRENSNEIDVRKGIADGKLFTVLEQRKISVGTTGMMGSSHIYEVENPGQSTMQSGAGTGAAGHGQYGAGQPPDKDIGLNQRKRDHDASDGNRGRPSKKQKGFKF